MTVASIMSIALQSVGIFFVIAAAVGLIRFKDPLQRMHASTKAGTVGAGLIILAVVIEMGRVDVTVIGLSAFAFLLLTVPIAGHVLGRAAYISGSSLVGLAGPDELEGVLDRAETPLDEALARRRTEALNDT
jgi:multicomponent Na+:H+ antiporter subunit G